MENREEILKVSNLKQYFKHGSGKNKIIVKAVDDISFKIYKGEVFSLVGESGCGKTTTGRTIIKLYSSSGGEVFFQGTRIISDVKNAKITYRETIRRLKDDKLDAVNKFKAQLEDNTLSRDVYDLSIGNINDAFNTEKEEAHEILRKAKNDRKFESIVDQEAREESRQFNEDSKEYIEIANMYKKLNIDLESQLTRLNEKLANSKLDKKELKELKAEIKFTSKELKLNTLRMKQDVKRYKYNLMNKNRLLMRKIQMIFQDPIASLNPRMTVKEIIAEGLRINGLKNEVEITRRVNDALETVGLVPEHASRYPHEFSGGQRQRIGIARALVVEPTLIIADEPISALDVSIRAQVINLLNDLRVEKGITILFIAHDLSVVQYFSDRVAVMYFGKIVEMGDKDKIFHNPFHPYTLSLMDSIPLPDPTYEKMRTSLSRYNPFADHDYSKQEPTLQEIEPNHFVLCNDEERAKYLSRMK